MKHDMNSIFYEAWFEELLSHPVVVNVFSRTKVGPSWGYRERVLDEHLLYWIVEGKMKAEWMDFQQEISSGEILWIPPKLSHTFTRLSPEMDVIHLRFSSNSTSLPGGQPFMISRGDASGKSRLLELLIEHRQQLPYRNTMFKAELASFLMSILRGHSDSEQGLSLSRRRKVMEALDHTHPKQWSSSLLAKHLGLSTVHFARLFITTFGEKPRSWLVREKMRRVSEELAESKDTIARIASKWGYEDPFLFSRQFKGVFGESPKHWRAHH